MNEVEWKTLGEACYFKKGTMITSKTAVEGSIPVISGGQKAAFYHNVPNRKGETIAIAGSGAYAGFVSYWDKPVFIADAFSISPKNEEELITKYLFYYLISIQNTIYNTKTTGGIPHVYSRFIENFSIPIPSPKVQQAIVDKLDIFTTLISRLESELELRQKQYVNYREDFYEASWNIATNDNENQDVRIESFSGLGDIIRGKRFVRDDIKEKGQPCIHYGDMYTYYGISACQTKTFLDYDFPKTMRYASKGDVVIVGAGENNIDIGVGVAWMGDEKTAVHDACYILKHEINAKYISHYLRTNLYHQQLKKYVSEGKICSFSAEGLGKVCIPVPKDPDRQRQIVETLDTFEHLITALKREITLRKKQYAYYREKLLTFE